MRSRTYLYGYSHKPQAGGDFLPPMGVRTRGGRVSDLQRQAVAGGNGSAYSARKP